MNKSELKHLEEKIAEEISKTEAAIIHYKETHLTHSSRKRYW
ncbi:hypothetical protein [Pontimicrobium sp. SW4]|uniref:Uncharacterized protein n=1 Tax=Pontimicrobium sp. SW4 TaxID=3153519 RepID=A0AAU7BWX5_9FLAO